MTAAFTTSAFMSIALAGTIPFSLAVAAWWLVAIAKMIATRRALGTCEDGLRQPDAKTRVLVVVPAHNEQKTIGALIDTLRAQDHPECRFVLALDRCTDATASIARERIVGDPRFVIHEIGHCPEGWAGKVHALDAAVRVHARDDDAALLFADADTVFHPSCVRAALSLLSARRLDMLSLLSTLTVEREFEVRTQGPCVFELMRRYPPSLASRDEDRRPFANGQFMLWTRSAYQRVGTHAAFRSELLEDIAMARAAWRERRRAQVIPAGAMLRCRMYADEAAFERGWRRIFTESANRKPWRLESWGNAALIRGAIVPVALSVVVGASIATWFLNDSTRWWPSLSLACAGVAALLSIAGIWTFLSHAGVEGSALVRSLIAWPSGCVRLRSILRSAATELRSNTPTSWAGRAYERPAR